MVIGFCGKSAASAPAGSRPEAVEATASQARERKEGGNWCMA
jgi:hypothetical protein